MKIQICLANLYFGDKNLQIKGDFQACGQEEFDQWT